MKKKIQYLFLAILLSITATGFVNAQEHSFPIETINNKEYYQYTVKPGDGLYSISKNFNTTQAEINRLNPHIHGGLRAGQTILIPIVKQKSQAAQTDKAHILIRHKVEPRQTLFAISRKYNVTQEAITNANPEILKNGLKAGTIILIPVNETELELTNDEPKTDISKGEIIQKDEEVTLHIGESGNFFIHTVKAEDTLYSIAKQYGVHVNDITALNSEAANVIRIGEELKIPIKVARKEEKSEKEVITKKEDKTSYKIAYLLPFMSNNSSIDPTSRRFIEFYLGSLLAVNNAKNNPIQYEIYAFDIEKSETKVHEVINKPEMQKMDLIIGPAYTGQIAIISDFAKRHRINTVIPFSSKVSQIENNPYLFQFNPDQDVQLDFLVNTIKNRFRFYNIIMVETGSKDKTEYSELKKRFDSHSIEYKQIKVENIETSLNPATNNLVIFDNEDYNDTKTYLANLQALSSTYSITTFGQYSWRAQQGAKPNMIYVSPFTGSEDATKYYESQFKQYYKKESNTFNPRFDILGYDLSNYFLSTMTKDGFNFDLNTQSLNYNKGVQSSFSFIRTNNNKGGFINTRMYLIEENAKTN